MGGWCGPPSLKVPAKRSAQHLGLLPQNQGARSGPPGEEQRPYLGTREQEPQRQAGPQCTQDGNGLTSEVSGAWTQERRGCLCSGTSVAATGWVTVPGEQGLGSRQKPLGCIQRSERRRGCLVSTARAVTRHPDVPRVSHMGGQAGDP